MTGTQVFNYPGASAYDTFDTEAVGGKKVQRVRLRGPDTSVVTQKNWSATNITLLAANAARLGATIFNNSTVAMAVKLGATCTATSFTVVISVQGYYELPFGYTGIIDGYFSAGGSGFAMVTELT